MRPARSSGEPFLIQGSPYVSAAARPPRDDPPERPEPPGELRRARATCHLRLTLLATRPNHASASASSGPDGGYDRPMPAPVREPDRPPDDDQARIEEERSRREAEELESFERRADWWSLHYGGRGDEAGER